VPAASRRSAAMARNRSESGTDGPIARVMPRVTIGAPPP
jgi:hypothetical protein